MDKCSKGVRFSEAPTPGLKALGASAPPDLVREDGFCEILGSSCGATLCFKVSRGQLRTLDESSDDVAEVKPEAGLPLSSILQGFRMSHGMRPVLAYILAKATWHYYDTSWMGLSWTNNRIYFMKGQDSSTYFCTPYLTTVFLDSSDSPAEFRQVPGMMHRYPRVLALGALLLEIATGEVVPVEDNPDEWTAKIANEQLRMLKSFLETRTLQDDCRFPIYRTVLESCFDLKLFKSAPFNPIRPKDNLQQRRRILYDRVVEPLRRLIEAAGWNTEFDRLGVEPLEPKTQSTESRPRPFPTAPPPSTEYVASGEMYKYPFGMSSCRHTPHVHFFTA